MEKMLGVMLDCSRNAVMTVDSAKQYITILKKMGYNTVMLYTEDTYEVDNQPCFGHLRGRYSKQELKEIDTFCVSIGIELVPCIQTLAHLENMFKWQGEYSDINDCDNILFIGEEKTYKLIEDMISTVSQCFSSKKIHIGMDEADRVGTGKYQRKHGIKDRFDIINEHLHKVCDIAAKYGFEPMIWSDMFRRLAMNVEDQYDSNLDTSKILEKAALPENISLVYWDYYSSDPERYKKNIKTDKIFGKPVYFAGGVWTWKGFAPDNKFSMEATQAALEACNECEVDGVFFTSWGDDGAECSKYCVLPSLMFAAEAAKGNTDMESIKLKFKEIVGCDFDDFMVIDKFDKLAGKHRFNPSKYLLYNDLFMGTMDTRCSEEDNLYYKDLAQEIAKVENKGDFELLFESYKKLAEALSIKANLGIRTREAYLNKDLKELQNLINEYSDFVEKLKEFHEVYEKAWHWENKPHGFDIQDIRLGGLLQRTLSCQKRLKKFVNGEISEIPELEEPVLEQNFGISRWKHMVSVNDISQ